MANGNALDAMRDMATKGALKASTALPVIIGSLADISESLESMRAETRRYRAEREEIELRRDQRQEGLADQIRDVKNEVQGNCASTDQLKAAVDKLNENPAIQIGAFVKTHPKVALAIVAIFLLLVNLWFVSGFRGAILTMLGVPTEIVQIFNPGITPVP